MIDRQYLDSQSYQTFQESWQNEQEQSTRLRKNFIDFVQKKVVVDNSSEARSLPIEITPKDIQSVIDQEPIPRSAVTSILGYSQIFYPLETIAGNDVRYHLFLTCKVASYKDCLIWFASTQNSELVQVKMISTYKKTLSYQAVPNIQFDSSTISIDIHRSVDYPLEVLTSHNHQFKLTGDGRVFRDSHK